MLFGTKNALWGGREYSATQASSFHVNISAVLLEALLLLFVCLYFWVEHNLCDFRFLNRGHTGRRPNPPLSTCGACLHFYRKNWSSVPVPWSTVVPNSVHTRFFCFAIHMGGSIAYASEIIGSSSRFRSQCLSYHDNRSCRQQVNQELRRRQHHVTSAPERLVDRPISPPQTPGETRRSRRHHRCSR